MNPTQITKLLKEVDKAGFLSVDALQRFIDAGWNPLVSLGKIHTQPVWRLVKDVKNSLISAGDVQKAYTHDFETEATQ